MFIIITPTRIKSVDKVKLIFTVNYLSYEVLQESNCLIFSLTHLNINIISFHFSHKPIPTNTALLPLFFKDSSVISLAERLLPVTT